MFLIFVMLMTGALFSQSLWANSLEYGPPVPVEGGFSVPAGLAIDEARNRVLVADSANHRIKYADIDDLAGTPTWSEFGYLSDRSLPAALNEPQALAVDANGHVFVVNTFDNEVQLYRWDGASYTYDDSFASTTRNSVAGVNIKLARDIAIAADGRIFLLDSGNNRILVADNADDDSWSVHLTDSTWGNPYGMDIASDNTFYLADTDNHRILKIPPSSPVVLIGNFGTANVQFRHPRDAAIGDDGRIYIADTYNHRVTVLTPSGGHYRNLGIAPLFSTLQKVVVDSSNHVYTIDSGLNRLVAYLGPLDPPPFDAYVRDYLGDTGVQPSDEDFILSSPDILVRHKNDINLADAASAGLTSYAYQAPQYKENNYVYIAVHNRGTHEITSVAAKLYWADPYTPLNFPEHWKADGFYNYYVSTSNNEASNTSIAHVVSAGNGVTVIGPIIWRPPAPESTGAGDGNLKFMVRLLHINDPSETAPGLQQVILNNNIALRDVQVTRGPFAIGDQDTIVVRVNYPDVSGSADETTVMDRISQLQAWLTDVSYGQTTIDPLFRGPVTLDNNKDHYNQPSRHLLIEMAEEVLNKLVGAESGILDGPTADPEDDIDRIIIVLNDPAYTRNWSTTGLWPYTFGSETRYLSVSVQGPANTVEQYTHGISHQFGLQDLYPYENVEFPITHPVDPWDNMATPFSGSHPLVWSKEYATWVTSSGGKILFIPRLPYESPREGEPAIHLNYQSIVESDEYAAIAIGLTEGATTFESETQFYWVEARSPDLSNADSVVPQDGVLLYYANKLIPQGHVPVIVRDVTPGTDVITDGAMQVNDTLSPPGTGIDVHVDSKVADNGGYMIEVDYRPPATDYNVKINKGDPGWTSPDIWVDNQRDGGGYHAYDGGTGHSSGPVEERPLGGQENRVYVRIYNDGPATAYNFEVEFLFSDPYHTVDGAGDFDLYKTVIVEQIPAGEYRDVFVVWEPDSEDDPHSCVRVHIRRLINDTNDGDNQAQQNLNVEYPSQSSPYDVVNFNFQVSNKEETNKLVYFRSEGIPTSWSKTLTPKSRLLNPGDEFSGTLSVQPNIDAPSCTSHPIYVTAWTPRGDTLVRLGGTTVDVNLRNRTNLTLDTGVQGCYQGKPHVSLTHVADTAVSDNAPSADDPGKFFANLGLAIDTKHPPKQCAIVTAVGCTNPVRANEVIIVKYQDPSGNPVYREVMTDASGCYEDFYPVVEGGEWEVEAYYPGTNCSGPATATVPGVLVPLEETNDQDGDGVADDDEIQGDADNDGAPNHLDWDSDDDGVPDADEPHQPDTDLTDGINPNDPDNDGLDNRVDPDSDNDGVSDGEDLFPYEPGKCEFSPQMTYWIRLLAGFLFILAIICFIVAYRQRNLLLGIISFILLIIIAIAGMMLCWDLYWKAGIGLVILACILFAFLLRRILPP